MDSNRKIRVLVVDDSALMRRHLSSMLSSSPAIEVCGIARDGNEAVQQHEKLVPDVITLDVDMPGKSGLETLPALFRVRMVPVIVVSSFTQSGTQITLDALDLGAMDFVGKPSSPIPSHIQQVRDELVSKVLAAATASLRPPPSPVRPPRETKLIPRKPAPTTAETALGRTCIAIGISTGGPPALTQVFEQLMPPLPPIVIVQHMPPEFTGPFSRRLNNLSKIEVKEAADGDELLPNRALIAPGGRHLLLKKLGQRVTAVLADTDLVSGHRPSVDVLFRSAASIYGPRSLGIIMTGMGRDGADGCREILSAGGRTLGQDAGSSVVYGMNKVAFTEGWVQSQFALDDLPTLLRKLAWPQ